MNIPGSIQAELDAAREEGRQAGLREAIAHCEAMEAEADAQSVKAYKEGLENAVACFDGISDAFDEAKQALKAKMGDV